ncbi:MAG: class II aldolase [Spirochaetaceae bacterium]|nr:MAG: class II aldolase [Spirochaetaceae bacterium]
MSLEQLVDLSRFYGANPQWVLAGGGNTSVKQNDTLYVKASGTTLADASEETFVRMDRTRLAGVLHKEYPRDADERERQALQDLMDARRPGEERRPSVETLMHELMPFRFVVHTHPPLVNGITCSREGQSAAQRVFGDTVVWVPNINPGLILARAVGDAIEAFRRQHNDAPRIILLQNHGLVAGADTAEEVRSLHKTIFGQVKGHVARMPDFDSIPYDGQRSELLAYQLVKRAQELDSGTPEYRSVLLTNREIARFVRSENAFAPLARAFSPDHIVYAGHRTPFLKLTDDIIAAKQAIGAALGAFLAESGRIPPVVAVQELGVFINGRTQRKMDAAAALFLDAVQVAVHAESFGGAVPLPPEQTEFIMGWEVERFRSQVSAGE